MGWAASRIRASNQIQANLLSEPKLFPFGRSGHHGATGKISAGILLSRLA